MTQTPKFENFDALYAHLFGLYEKKQYAEALETAVSEGKHYPDQINYLRYFRACMSGCLDQKDEAIKLLEEMLADDYWLGEAAWDDPDFDSIRDLPEFERLKAQSVKLWLAAQAKARPELLTILPEGYANDKPLPLLIALHGNFSSVRWHKDHWRDVANKGWLVGLPQSSQVFGLDSEGAVAYVWNDYDWAKREVSAHHAALTRAYPVDPERIVLGGFSRGAEMAIQLALSWAIPARGFIAVCPGGPNTTTPELWEPIVKLAKGRNLRGYVIMGGQDRFVSGTKHLVKLLDEAGIKHEFEVHPDMGHDYPPDFKNRLDQMLPYVLDG